MNSDVLLQTTCTALSIAGTQTDARDLTNIMSIRGYHKYYWDEAVEKTADEFRNKRLRSSISKVLSIYEEICDKKIKTDCTHCHRSGYVSVITIAGDHKGKHKHFIFDHNQNQGQGKHLSFVRKKALGGSPFLPLQMFVSCICENGEKRNARFGDRDWLNKDSRQRAIERAFHGPTAEFDQQNWIGLLTAIAENQENSYQWQKLEEKTDQETQQLLAALRGKGVK